MAVTHLHTRLEGVSTATALWSDLVADRILTDEPNLPLYTCAAGISPSGIVHFGNFRDIATAYAVLAALKARGKNVRFLFFWDNYDRLRKVPANVDPSWYVHIGKPLSAVPDPLGELPSYAARFEREFVEANQLLSIPVEFCDQTAAYTSGVYAQDVITALKARTQIAEILLSFMSDKGKELKEIDPAEYVRTFFPVSVYSRFTGKDTTTILSFENDHDLTYRCDETGNIETLDLTRDFCVKLNWKIDWAMRWAREKTIFEPGGIDHASPNGSYDVSARLVRDVYGEEPPYFVGYGFVGIQGLGSKMSGSKGNAVSPKQLLEIYEPALLKWLYFRKDPEQVFSLAFDSEVIRQYDEFDREQAMATKDELSAPRKEALRLSERSATGTPIPFRQAVALGQIFQWNVDRVVEFAQKINESWSSDSITARLACAKAWLTTYNPADLLTVRTTRNDTYVATLSEEAKGQIRRFREVLSDETLVDIQALEVVMYDIPKDPNLSQKENSPRQRAFFTDLYQLLIDRDTGPRLSTFLSALPREQVCRLLDV